MANYYLNDNHGFGMFSAHGVPRKNYFAMQAFRGLLDTPLRVHAAGGDPAQLTLCAGVSRDKTAAGILISNFRSTAQPVRLTVRNLPWQGGTRYELALVDAARDLAVARTGTLPAEPLDLSSELKAPALGLLTLKRE